MSEGATKQDGDLLAILRAIGALKEGHFLLASGRHSDRYIEKFDLLRRPSDTVHACRSIAARFADEEVETVVGPTTGGILLAYEVARQLGVASAYAERAEMGGTGRVFRRGQTFRAGERVLVVDDILTTGSSVVETLAALHPYRADVVGVAVLVDRRGSGIHLPAPLFAAATLTIATWDAVECPLCAAGLPLVKPGSTTPVAR